MSVHLVPAAAEVATLTSEKAVHLLRQSSLALPDREKAVVAVAEEAEVEGIDLNRHKKVERLQSVKL